MDEATRRWIVGVVRREVTTDADGREFLAWAVAALRRAGRQHGALEWFWPFSDEDLFELTDEYAARLLNPRFRPHWASLPDDDIQRLVIDDFYGEFLTTQKDKRQREGLYAQPPEPSVNDDGESLYERDDAAVIRARCGSAQAINSVGPITANEVASAPTPDLLEDEAIWAELKQCTANYCMAEWPADWPSKRKALAAHILLWYEQEKPLADLHDYELAEIIGLASAAEASRRLRDARIAYHSRPDLERDGIIAQDETLLFMRLRLVLQRRQR